MLAIVVACLAMAAQDFFDTMLTVARAKGRPWLSGGLDAIGDLAKVVCVIVGAGTVIADGVTWHSVAVLAAMAVTSFFGTAADVKISRRIKAAT